jgi:AraC-like DNA-binding protein/predicted transcriptional regulator YdeE
MDEAKAVWETYASAWKAEGAAAKRTLLARSVAGSATYRDPLAECHGHDALIGYMLQFHEQIPGGHFETVQFLAHHGRSIARLEHARRQRAEGGRGHELRRVRRRWPARRDERLLRRAAGGVSYLRQIQRGIDFIETHLEEDFEISAVTRHAGVSHWHFQRVFKALTNETLKGYVRSRRLANALLALHERRSSILEIALASGFESQAAFTRAFKHAFGMTPAKYRALGSRTEFVRKLRIDEEYLRHLGSGVCLAPTWVTRPKMTLVGLRTRFFGIDSDKSNIGQKLPPLWSAFLARVHEVSGAQTDVLYGVVIPTPGQEQLDYLAGALVPGRPAVPENMTALAVPAATYAEFTHRGLPQELNRTVSYIYASWLLASDVRHTYAPDLELYGADYVADSSNSVIRYAIPVRPRAR